MRGESETDARSTRTILLVCVAVTALGLTWTFLGMRSALGVGGSCADGGPYVSRQSCPDGSLWLFVAIPVLVGAAVWGSSAAGAVGAPGLLLPVWAGTFTALGWNFWEFGLTAAPDGWVLGWVICGALFWVMAAPAIWLMARAVVGAQQWWLLYAGLAAAAAAVGAVGFYALT